MLAAFLFYENKKQHKIYFTASKYACCQCIIGTKQKRCNAD
ncbi:MAG: hypothetical protein RJA07_741 [Bacteroidota bacterium]